MGLRLLQSPIAGFQISLWSLGFFNYYKWVFVSYVIRQPLLVMMVESGTSKAFMIKGTR
ncbi:hypothetical protein HanPI659440_Chr00c20g0734701 [Helianthus annuus]|nr:hypothetical protein HanPI659440_Chr00c20g0734701 [Helianthus annuus]